MPGVKSEPINDQLKLQTGNTTYNNTDVLKSLEVFLRGACYIFCTSSKITQNQQLSNLSNSRSHQRKMLIQHLTLLIHHKQYVDCRRRIASWKFGFFNGDTALDTNSTSTRNHPKINPSKIVTVGSTRQWIKLNYLTNTYFHK